MLQEFCGKKIGMTQIFDLEGNIIPVTAVSIDGWFVTQIKTDQVDGYFSAQVGLVRDRYLGFSFDLTWLKEKKKYFLCFKEVSFSRDSGIDILVGQKVCFDLLKVAAGDSLCVSGYSIGRGFQGVVKRWGFQGGPASHGSKFHRIPGSMGHMRREGHVIKGKRLPGRCGGEKITVRGLRCVELNREQSCVFIKGALPGKRDSVLKISKSV